MEKHMNIQSIEQALGARQVGLYESGHMGSKVLRLIRNSDGMELIAKFAYNDNKVAIADIEANIKGYSMMELIGASALVPPEFKEFKDTDGRAIIIKDLGISMRYADGGIADCLALWDRFKPIIISTAVSKKNSSNNLPSYVSEVLIHIERFSQQHHIQVSELIRQAEWIDQRTKSAIMLLDFTPDNLFVGTSSLSFIDPWAQESYLGHPAVCIGQFVTLMQIYGMNQANEVARVLRDKCLAELPGILDCNTDSVVEAFVLGVTLQYVLSSYVRKDIDPTKSLELYQQACKFWKQ